MQKTIRVDLPPCGPGQAANLELVIHWRQQPQPDDRRFITPLPPVELDAKQQALLRRWQQQRPLVHSVRLAADSVAWRCAEVGQLLIDDNGCDLPALGHGLLWQAVGESAVWMDVAMAVHLGGRWHLCRPQLVDEWIDGEMRCWLLLDADTDPTILAAVEALRRAMHEPHRVCWVVRLVGLGAFLMAGVDLDPA